MRRDVLLRSCVQAHHACRVVLRMWGCEELACCVGVSGAKPFTGSSLQELGW